MFHRTENNEIWRFETAKFAIVAYAHEEDIDPADSFEFEDDIAFARSGDPAHWFCAEVVVRHKETGAILGRDTLGGCSYQSFDDFTRDHWRSAVDGRNTLAMKAKSTVICHYFPDMVRVALAEARKVAADLRP